MAVTCDHRIRSLATTNKKTGFGSLVTTKCGHLRPQNITFADRANKTSTVHAVTCDHTSRSLATKNWDHLASLGSLVPMHGVGGVGGGGGMITYLALQHILAEHITCIPARGGWGGWGGMITCLALAHIQTEHTTCTHARGGWGGWCRWGGWDDTVQRLGQLSLASPKIRQGNSFKGKDSPSPSRDGLSSSCSDKHGLLVKTVYFPFLYAPPFSTFFRLFPLHFCTPEVWGII